MPPASSSASSFQRNVFLALLGVWCFMPIALHGRVAQDAVPYITAGKLARHQPNDVYAARNGDIYDLTPRFRAAWCNAAPPGTDCDGLGVAFVSAPPVLPIAILLASLGAGVGTFIMQCSAAFMLAAGMWLLWGRLAHRSRHAPWMLVGTALLLTPMAMVPIGLGQTSPILFLSVCVGLGGRSARSRIGQGVIWGAASVLKVFPLVLAPLFVRRRRSSALGWAGLAVAVLSLCTIALVPVSVWGDFVRTTLDLNGSTTTSAYNGSVSALVARVVDLPLIARGVSLLGAGVVCWFGFRGTNDDTKWAGGYVAILLITPLVWWHYVWVLIGAIGLALSAQKRLDDKTMAILPGVAALSVLPSVPNANGNPLGLVQSILLLVFAAIFCVLAKRSVRSVTQRKPEFSERV